MPNNPLTPAELQAYINPLGVPQMPAGYFLASPVSVPGPFAYRLFDASYISLGIIDPNRLGTGSTGAGNLYLADDGTWKAVGGGGGAVDRIIAGTNISISPAGGTGDVTINATTLNPDPTGYGSFYSTQNQSLAAIDIPQIVTFNNTYEANDVSLVSNRIYFAKAGTYQFAYVAQIFNSSNDIQHCEFWIKYNGVDFPNSATHITVQSRKSASEPSEQQMKLILSGTAQNDGDYIELYWQGSTTSLQLGYVAPGVDGPVGSPSVIANIIPIGAQGRDSNLNELNDVLITTPSTGQLLRRDSDGLWKNWTSNFLTTVPTLAQVTTAGNTTTNAITVGGLTVDTNVLVVDSINDRVGFGTTTPTYRVDAQGTLATHAIRSHIGYDIYPVPEPTSLTAVVSAGGSVDTGLHGYYVTFITALGETRPRSLFGTTTTAGNNTVTLTLPISSDPRVTGRKIYRTKAGSNYNEYLLATINNNVTTTYVDTAADSTLTLQYRGAYYRANTTSNQITLSGQRAMLVDQNATYFGLRAGDSITSGGYSVFLGTWAGLNMTTGLSNTFVGYLSASSATTGDDNVIIGTTASYNATTLNRNVVLGTLAGRYHTGGSANITTMTDSIFIGMRSYAATATPANTIVIGYLAESLGDNTVVLGNSSIVRTALRGNVLINTSTDAGYKLDVNGTTRILGTVEIGSHSAVQGGPSLYQRYSGANIIGSMSTEYGSGAMILGYGAVGKSGVAGYVSSFDNFSGFRSAIKIGQLTAFTVLGTTSAVATTVGSDLTMNTLFQITNAGNVGIGTTSPAYRVDVQGTTLVDSSVSVQGAFNINPLAAPPAIGGFTLSAGTNLGVGQYYYFVTYVTAIGETSAGTVLSVVTTTGNTTVNLTGIPVSSDPRVTARKLYRTTLNQSADGQKFLATISNNTATTYTDSATDASLTGTTLQYYKVNTTARYFTVSGTQGMVIDANLTALGRNAGNAIIASSGAAIRTVLIGASAGQNITTGQANVIVGVAGASITTGSNNTLIGDLAGYAVNTGYSNTIIGAQAGRHLTSGYNNIFIGPSAGSRLADGTTNVTTAFQNIVIGRNARMSTINDSNSIIIGDTALGLGTNTTVIGNSSTTFTSIPAGNMTVGGTVNAGYKLDVQGNIRSTSLTTDGPVVSNSGVLTSVAGYTGMVTIQQPTPLPPVTFDIQNGIIVSVL